MISRTGAWSEEKQSELLISFATKYIYVYLPKIIPKIWFYMIPRTIAGKKNKVNYRVALILSLFIYILAVED